MLLSSRKAAPTKCTPEDSVFATVAGRNARMKTARSIISSASTARVMLYMKKSKRAPSQIAENKRTLVGNAYGMAAAASANFQTVANTPGRTDIASSQRCTGTPLNILFTINNMTNRMAACNFTLGEGKGFPSSSSNQC